MTSAASQTPGALGSGASFTRQSPSNGGVTLTYNPANDAYELRDCAGNLVWQGSPSSLTQNQMTTSGIGVPGHIYYNPLTNSGSAGGGGSPYINVLGGSGSAGSPYINVLGGSGTTGAVYRGGGHSHNFSTDLKSEGIRAGEIIAWRAWRVKGDCLRSAVMDSIWSEHEPMIGDPIKDYGVHAYNCKEGPYVDGYAGPGVMISFADGWVSGQVALWGEIVEHKLGYRAQYARVHSLDEWYEYIPEHQRQALIKKYVRKPNGQQTVE